MALLAEYYKGNKKFERLGDDAERIARIGESLQAAYKVEPLVQVTGDCGCGVMQAVNSVFMLVFVNDLCYHKGTK